MHSSKQHHGHSHYTFGTKKKKKLMINEFELIQHRQHTGRIGRIDKNSLTYCNEDIECLLLEWKPNIIRNYNLSPRIESSYLL